MKPSLITIALAVLALSGCAASDGNPDGFVYIGSPGSAYDVKANPPQTSGIVAYDPEGPMPATPSDVEGAAGPNGAGPLTGGTAIANPIAQTKH